MYMQLELLFINYSFINFIGNYLNSNKMPLKKGKSKKVISSNIEELLHNYKEDGMIGTSHPKSMKKAQEQAVAIAYSLAKKK
jgi:ABC-type sulfate/molybdate transport systems ATPase subunit